MIFEKAIRRRQSPLPSLGHHEVDSTVTSGSPILQLQPQVGELSFIHELVEWPQKIDLLVHWQQLPLDRVDVKAQEIVSGMPMGIKDFYARKTSDKPELAASSRHKAIILFFREGHESLATNQQLYTKTYLSQDDGLLMQHRKSQGEGHWWMKVPKTGEEGNDMLPLLAYGCHAPPGCSFADIQQTYASIGADGNDTRISLYTESALRQRGIVQPDGGTIDGWRYIFIDRHANPSLIGDITNHKIEVPITIGEVTRTYVSVAYRESSESNQLIYLTIKPK